MTSKPLLPVSKIIGGEEILKEQWISSKWDLKNNVIDNNIRENQILRINLTKSVSKQRV